jgi:hypothetical protein
MTAQNFLRHKLHALHHQDDGMSAGIVFVHDDPASDCAHESVEVTWDHAEGCSAYHCQGCGRQIPRDDLPEVWRVWRP